MHASRWTASRSDDWPAGMFPAGGAWRPLSSRARLSVSRRSVLQRPVKGSLPTRPSPCSRQAAGRTVETLLGERATGLAPIENAAVRLGRPHNDDCIRTPPFGLCPPGSMGSMGASPDHLIEHQSPGLVSLGAQLPLIHSLFDNPKLRV